ncbi:hypothetical protein MASR2M79_25050 [Aminivibrio sp.]
MGNGQVIDCMVADGLTDIFNNYHMGITAENIVEQYGFTREEQDRLAFSSQARAENAIRAGRFKEEMVPVSMPTPEERRSRWKEWIRMNTPNSARRWKRLRSFVSIQEKMVL